MPKERNKADGYREKAPIKREKSEACIDSAESEVPRPKVKAYEGDTKAIHRTIPPLAYAASPITCGKLCLGIAAIGSQLIPLSSSIGALLGMKIWHHKTMHKKFKYSLPLILIIQIILIGYLSK